MIFNGTILATRSALTRSNRPVPSARTPAQETVVCRAVAPAHARAFRRNWIADSEHVLLLFEPGRYPVAYFPETDVSPDALQRTEYTTRHPDLGLTSWYTVRAGERSVPRGSWQHIDLPAHASELRERVAFAWRAIDAFYEEDERIVGHAADAYHRIDIRQPHVISSSETPDRSHRRHHANPLALYESGFAPRWYVRREDVNESALTLAEGQTFCPTKAWPAITTSGTTEGRVVLHPCVARSGARDNMVSFEPDRNRRLPRRGTAAPRARSSRHRSRHRPRTRRRRSPPERPKPK